MPFYQIPFWTPQQHLCSDVLLSLVPGSFWVQLSSWSQRGDTRIKHSCGCGTGAPAGCGAAAASRGHWVKPIWTSAINIKETTTLNGFGIWNQKPNLNVRAGPYLQTKLNWMFRPQLWQRNESHKSKSAFLRFSPSCDANNTLPFHNLQYFRNFEMIYQVSHTSQSDSKEPVCWKYHPKARAGLGWGWISALLVAVWRYQDCKVLSVPL